MEIDIRPFDVAQKQQVVDLSLRAWAPVFDGMKPAVPDYVYEAFYPQGWQVRQSLDVEALLDTGDGIWVALQGERVIGWIGVRMHPDDRMGEIHILAVDPQYQRRGVAKVLIGFAVEQMRQSGMEIAMVETGDDPGHAGSRLTYENAGFERWPVARYFRKI